MTYFYSDKDGNVKMHSEGKIEAPNLIEHYFELTDTEKEKIELNAQQKIVGKSLQLTEVQPLLTDTTEERKILKENLKDLSQKAKTATDLKPILDSIINQILV